MRRPNWLLIIVLLGVLASGQQLVSKGQLEPLQRQVGLAVDVTEITDTAWWPELQAAGVHFVLASTPDQVAMLPAGVRPVALMTPESMQLWQASGVVPAAIVFVDNKFNSEMATAVQAMDMPVGLVEFKPPTDFAATANDWAGQLLRVYDQPAHPFINEFPIAVRERQVDLAVVRLDPTATPPLGLAHVQEVSAALLADGHELASQLQTRAVLPTFTWVFYVQVLALGALLAWLLGFVLAPSWQRLLMIIPLLAVVGTFATVRLLGAWQTRQLVALAVALTYPGAAIFWWRSRTPADAKGAGPAAGALYEFMVITAFALAGGLSIHAILSDYVFHLHILQFTGVKIAYALPLALAFLLVVSAWLRYGLGSGFRFRNRYLRLLALVLVILVFIVAVYVLLNRTGNQSRVRILPIELEFRDWLYRTFQVRPRTKEFLGYPLLLAGLYLWRRQARLGGGFAILIGLIAELSLVNTFAHLHHPIMLSLMRAGIGLAIGVSLGLLAMLILRLVLPAKEGWQ